MTPSTPANAANPLWPAVAGAIQDFPSLEVRVARQSRCNVPKGLATKMALQAQFFRRVVGQEQVPSFRIDCTKIEFPYRLRSAGESAVARWWPPGRVGRREGNGSRSLPDGGIHTWDATIGSMVV